MGPTYLDEYKSIGTNWVALYVNGNSETYFDSFDVKQLAMNRVD